MRLLHDCRFVFGLLSPEDRRKALWLQLLTIVSGVIQAFGVISVLPFIALITNPGLIDTNPYLQRVFELFAFEHITAFMVFLGLGSAFILAAGNGIMTLTIWVTARFYNSCEVRLQHRLLSTYLLADYARQLARNSAELSKNVLWEVERVVIGSMLAFINLVGSAITTLLLIGVLLYIDPIVTLITAAILGITYAVIFLGIRRRLTALSKEHIRLATDVFTYVREALEGMKTIKVLGREPFFARRYAERGQEAADNAVAHAVLEFIPGPLLETITFLVIVLVTVYFAASPAHSEWLIPTLATFALAAYRLVPALKSIFDGIEQLTFNSVALEVLEEDLRATPDWSDTAAAPLELRDRLVCQHVSFRYPGDRDAGLHDINFELPAGQTLCVVGATGSGKSTLVDVIIGLLQADKGSILVDGVEISGANTRRWQRAIGYVPQVIYLTDDTILRNIAFGVSDEEIDHGRVVQATKLARLHEFVSTSLPQGYATVVGERGVSLSGGQRQRIGIARALYDGADILILDEATSELDANTEAEIANSLFDLGGKTIIFATHARSIAEQCDHVLALAHGRQLGHGAYAELMDTNTEFRNLMAQSSRHARAI